MGADPSDIINGRTVPAQDYILLAYQRSPGVAFIEGAALQRALDVPKAYGQSGAPVRYVGDRPSEFDVRIQIWEKEHWGQWAVFANVLAKAPKGVAAFALPIVHPLLNRAPLSITSVVIQEVTQFAQVKAGLWECKIRMVEFRPQQDAIGNPRGAIPAAGNGIAPFEADPEIAALIAKQAAMGGVL